MSKELWFAEMERLMDEGASYESASDRAYDSMRERLFDRADMDRKRRKEEGTQAAQAAPPTPLPTAGE